LTGRFYSFDLLLTFIFRFRLLLLPKQGGLFMPGGIKAAVLKVGDTIGVVAPGSPVRSGEMLTGIEAELVGRGYKVCFGENLRAASGYLAGSDLVRRADLERMWLDESVAAIWCLRGGYGSVRLLPRLCFRLLSARPKILVGFSDITALELGLWSQIKMVTFHGPVLNTLQDSEFTKHHAFKMLSGKSTGIFDPPEMTGSHYWTIKPGKARGRLLGGNLATICSLIGTRFLPDFEGTILFLEDTGEAAYRIDRMLTQLTLSCVFENVAGVMVGRCIPVEGESEADLIRVFQERLGELGCPTGYGFPIGHGKEQWTIPQGVMAEVDMEAGRLELLERALI
jgi:muramoyltetrapeptide carboxypeptidase